MQNLTTTNQPTQDLPTSQTAMQVIDEGRERAKQLMDIVNQNQWAKNIQGKNYLQVEAWQTLGKFYGYTAKTKTTEYVEMGAIKGFNATVEILDSKGQVIGGSEAGCYTDEKKWATSPMYSLKSMAQTRALGKAYRQILSWVAVLAGYEPTPAEEMDGIIVSNGNGYTPQAQGFVPATPAQLDRLSKNLSHYKGDRAALLAKYGVKDGLVTWSMTDEQMQEMNLTKRTASDLIGDFAQKWEASEAYTRSGKPKNEEVKFEEMDRIMSSD